MSSPQSLSVELPSEISHLVSDDAFSNYTVSGPNKKKRPDLNELTARDLFPNGVNDRDMADCCVSGIWLLHNFLPESHEISQSIHSREGSYWHGVMHRLEGDFWNSKYWYQKVGEHPVYESIGTSSWNPNDYVDQCEAAEGSEELAVAVQLVAVQEWKALFEYCFNQASSA